MRDKIKEVPTTAVVTGTENPAPTSGEGAGANSWPETATAAITATRRALTMKLLI